MEELKADRKMETGEELEIETIKEELQAIKELIFKFMNPIVLSPNSPCSLTGLGKFLFMKNKDSNLMCVWDMWIYLEIIKNLDQVRMNGNLLNVCIWKK